MLQKPEHLIVRASASSPLIASPPKPPTAAGSLWFTRLQTQASKNSSSENFSNPSAELSEREAFLELYRVRIELPKSAGEAEAGVKRTAEGDALHCRGRAEAAYDAALAGLRADVRNTALVDLAGAGAAGTGAAGAASPLWKMPRLARALERGLVERGLHARLLLLALCCQEHAVMVGAPGTAKSMLAGRLRDACVENAFFQSLLTRFTVPEELFGPLSLKALEADRHERQPAGYLPASDVVFLDEIFKASSAILNTLLQALNERQFRNGDRMEAIPLRCCVGASNEVPQSPELRALYDRILWRIPVRPVSRESMEALIGDAGTTALSVRGEIAPELRLSREDFAYLDELWRGVELPADIVAILVRLRAYLRDQCEPPIAMSDRRALKVAKALRVAAGE